MTIYTTKHNLVAVRTLCLSAIRLNEHSEFKPDNFPTHLFLTKEAHATQFFRRSASSATLGKKNADGLSYAISRQSGADVAMT